MGKKTRSKGIVDKYYNASLALYTAIKSNKYVKLESISRDYKINNSFFRRLVQLGIIDKVGNGIYIWKHEDESWQSCPLDRADIEMVMDDIVEHNKKLAEEKTEFSEPESEVEPEAEAVNNTEEEAISNEAPEQNILSNNCSYDRMVMTYDLMKTLIENKSVPLEKAPSTAVDMIDHMLSKLEERKNGAV